VEHVDVVIVGGGQAGLAVSHELSHRELEHVVLERGRIGETWRGRWDTVCLVTPNWSVQLPGHGYDGSEPDGFMARDEIVAYLERYAAGNAAPIREGVDVVSIEARSGSGFIVRTTGADLSTDHLVLATGAFQQPFRPTGADALPGDVFTLDVTAYRNADALPEGGVLIIGSGQSGCQIAEELCEAGRDVVLACGKAPWSPRRLGAHDMFWWAAETGFLDASVSSLPSPAARLAGNILATGHGGGHDLHLRTLRELGVTLTGHFVGVEDDCARFAPDLVQSIAWGDDRFRDFMGLVTRVVAERDLEPFAVPEPEPFEDPGPAKIDLHGIRTVLFAGGFRPSYTSWLPWPAAFDDLGFPIQQDGASTVVPGLYFAGVHFLRSRKSSLLFGVGEDASAVAAAIAERIGTVQRT
jgi:glycine/D-amino acid oxidase-like deaminating enzyme